MTIALKPGQEAQKLIDERGFSDDMGWAKPLVEEAREAMARGETIALEEHRARNAERLAAFRR